MGTLRAVRVLNGSKVAVHQRATLLSERPLNVALLVLDPEATAGLGATNRDILTRVADQVAAANARLARVEQTKRFTVLDAEWRLGDELTPTMKLRRRHATEKYAAEIEALYAG